MGTAFPTSVKWMMFKQNALFHEKHIDISFLLILICYPDYPSPISSFLVPQAKLTLLILNTYVVHYLFTLYFSFLLKILN